jgi:hypothetical protein
MHDDCFMVHTCYKLPFHSTTPDVFHPSAQRSDASLICRFPRSSYSVEPPFKTNSQQRSNPGHVQNLPRLQFVSWEPFLIRMNAITATFTIQAVPKSVMSSCQRHAPPIPTHQTHPVRYQSLGQAAEIPIRGTYGIGNPPSPPLNSTQDQRLDHLPFTLISPR